MKLPVSRGSSCFGVSSRSAAGVRVMAEPTEWRHRNGTWPVHDERCENIFLTNSILALEVADNLIAGSIWRTAELELTIPA